MRAGREKSSPRRRIYSGARRDEKNRRFVSWQFKGKGARKLNISFAPLEKL